MNTLISTSSLAQSLAIATRPARTRMENSYLKLLEKEGAEDIDVSSAARPASSSKRARSASAQRMESARKRTKICLVPKRARSDTAAASAQGVEPARKCAKISFSPVWVVFIGCGGDGLDVTTNARRRHLLRAVRNALDAGATMINISFSRIASGHLGDPESLIPELWSEFHATWGSSVGQPAYSYLRYGW